MNHFNTIRFWHLLIITCLLSIFGLILAISGATTKPLQFENHLDLGIGAILGLMVDDISQDKIYDGPVSKAGKSSVLNSPIYRFGAAKANLFDPSTKRVNSSTGLPGTPLTYTITLSHTSLTDISNVLVTDTLPISLTYIADSLTATKGNYGHNSGVITWTGSVSAGEAVSITFGATVDPSTPLGAAIINSAIISGAGEIITTRPVTVSIEQEPQRLYLPLILRNSCSPFFDDFSNPASGWTTSDNSFFLSEYLNGEFRILTRQSNFFFPFRAPTACALQNYIVETDLRWVGSPGLAYGLMFGLPDTANPTFDQFYRFEINTTSQEFRLSYYNGAIFIDIAPLAFSPAIKSGAETNHLKVIRDGPQITLEINGMPLGTFSDARISGSTRVGIMVSIPAGDNPTSDARFDNFSVTGSLNSSAE